MAMVFLVMGRVNWIGRFVKTGMIDSIFSCALRSMDVFSCFFSTSCLNAHVY